MYPIVFLVQPPLDYIFCFVDKWNVYSKTLQLDVFVIFHSNRSSKNIPNDFKEVFYWERNRTDHKTHKQHQVIQSLCNHLEGKYFLT